METSSFTSASRAGVAAALGAYILWGILPIYWKMIHFVSAHEILAHRIVWSFVFMVVVLFLSGRFASFYAEARQIVTEPKKLLGITMASLLISVNWLTYIWAVNDNRIVETSLGYYMNPLVSVLLGVGVLKERLSFRQKLSFFLAFLGVLNMVVQVGTIPWVALILAISFALYGMFKKMVHAGAFTGLTLETLLVSPLAFFYLTRVYQGAETLPWLENTATLWLLIGTGVITAIPLILFARGANSLSLTLLGFLQYVSPTIALLLGIFLYNETFTLSHLVSFSFIWLALAVFSSGNIKGFAKVKNQWKKHEEIRES